MQRSQHSKRLNNPPRGASQLAPETGTESNAKRKWSRRRRRRRLPLLKLRRQRPRSSPSPPTMSLTHCQRIKPTPQSQRDQRCTPPMYPCAHTPCTQNTSYGKSIAQKIKRPLDQMTPSPRTKCQVTQGTGKKKLKNVCTHTSPHPRLRLQGRSQSSRRTKGIVDVSSPMKHSPVPCWPSVMRPRSMESC